MRALSAFELEAPLCLQESAANVDVEEVIYMDRAIPPLIVGAGGWLLEKWAAR
jgi:hypothetical protein